MEWKGPWSSDKTYSQGDVVGYQGSSYIAIVSAPPKETPPAAGTNWDIVAQGAYTGLSWKGEWDNSKQYHLNDVMTLPRN